MGRRGEGWRQEGEKGRDDKGKRGGDGEERDKWSREGGRDTRNKAKIGGKIKK